MWKLLYIFMLGYEVDFGHMQVIGLISATKFAEKQVGYTATSVLLNETHEFLRLVINSVREDIIGRHESHQCLALSFVANVGGREFADSLAADVQVVLTNSAVRPIVRKKAALALLRLFRRNREILLPETFAQKMLNLLDERDLGILTGVISLLTGIVSHDYRGYEACIPKVCDVMKRLARNKDVPLDYLYYALPSPWLQVKCMRVLQYYPTPEDPEYRQAETDVIHQIFTGTNMVRNVNKNNALHSVLFEAVNLANMLDLEDRTLLTESIETLGSFVEMEEPNIVYLGLQYLTKMVAPDTLEAIKQYESLVVTRLHHGDISIRRRALDLLYAMCDGNNAKQIVGHLLTYMITADFNIREELALKTAILAERYSGGSVQNKRWFLDVSLALIEKAGDYVSDAHWHRVVQIVTNAPELHEPAARESLARLRDGASHDMFVKLAAYLLGEFGHALAATERPSSYASILMAMHERVGTHAREIILSALAKMCMHAGSDEALRKMVGELFKADASTAAVELQQRAVEYYVMTNTKDYHATLRSVMDQMPEFPNRESKLEKNLEEAVGETADAAVVKRDRVAATATAVIAANRWRAGRGGGGGGGGGGATADANDVPTMGLADLLGGSSVPDALGGERGGGAAEPATATAGAMIDPLEAMMGAAAITPAAAGAGATMDPLEALMGGAPAAAPAAITPAAGALIDPLEAMMGGAPERPAAAPAASTYGGLDDLLGGGGGAPPPAPAPTDDVAAIMDPLAAAPAHRAPPPAPEPQHVAAAAAVVDPYAAAAPPPSVSATPAVAPTVNVAECLKKLRAADNGLLYEDPYIQIGVKSQWQGNQGRVMFYLGNKHDVDLNQLELTLSSTPGLNARLAPAPPSLGSKKQVQVLLELAAASGYAGSPVVTLRYDVAGIGSVHQNLTTPYGAHKFLTPWAAPDAGAFFAKWHETTAAAQSVDVVTVSAEISSGGLPAIERALTSVNAHVLPGLDPNVNNVVAASTVTYSNGAECFALARVESDANNRAVFRVTVAASDRGTMEGVQAALYSQILAP